MSDEELIPCDDELNRLKEFLLNQKRDRYEREMPCGVEWREKWRAFKKNELQELVEFIRKPNGSKCLRCGRVLLGLATARCDECLEEWQKEKKDAVEREDEDCE